MALLSTGIDAWEMDAATYGRLVASGALEGQRVELLDGIIHRMSPQSPEHALLIERLNRHLLASPLRVRPQLPLAAAAHSVPEPDLALVGDGPIHTHPDTAELVIEVSLSSDRVDRGRKQELYAAAQIPVSWRVDIAQRLVEVRTDPAPAGYRTLQSFGPGDTVPSPGHGVPALALDDLFRDF